MSGAVPKLRFPEFTGEWDAMEISGVVDSLDAGVSVNSEDRLAVGSERAVLKTSCVTLGYFDVTENKVVNDPFEIARLKEPVAKKTIILSRMNTPQLVGANAFVAHDFPNVFLPDRLWAAKISAKADPEWVGYLFAHPKTRNGMTDRATGTSGSMKNLSKDAVLTLPIHVPSLPEQQKIASFLGAVDDKISGLRRKEAALARFKAGLMQKLFSQKLRFTRDDGSAFPDWKEKQLGALVDLISGQHLGPNDYASDAQGLPYFSGPSDFTNSHREVTKWTTTPAAKVALPGDTLITVKGSGVGELLSLRFASVAMGRQLMAIRGTAIDGRLVYHRLSSERHEFQARAAGNMIPGLSRSDILSLKFTLPTHPEEQRKIADALSMLDAKNDSVRRQISKMETFKKGLLQQMFV